jgi:hypothetical protein
MNKRMTLFITACLLLVAVSACGPTSDRYSAVSQHSGKCLSLNINGGYYDGDPIEQWDCAHYHMALEKEWLFVPLPGAASNYQIKSIHSGKCLEVKVSATSGKNNGDIVQQSKCTGADNQKWNVVTASPGNTTFTSLYSGKCLQVRLGSTGGAQDGDTIEQWDCSAGAKNQIWKLTIASPAPPNPPLDTGTGELCNACNPANPQCKPGALCIVMPSGQSICGQSCSATVACPQGYACQKMVRGAQTYFQCVPNGNSCPL